MSKHLTVSPNEAADRLSLRELIEAYAHCADRRAAKGQMALFTADRATGEAYCLAHHVTVDGSKRRLMVASLRYLDAFVKTGGAWLFSERLLYVDWVDERVLS
jgi:SnoaL-like domain